MTRCAACCRDPGWRVYHIGRFPQPFTAALPGGSNLCPAGAVRRCKASKIMENSKEDKGRRLAMGACIACCGTMALVVFGGGTLLSTAAAFVSPSLALMLVGWLAIGAAVYSIWRRNRAAACCKPTENAG